MISLFLRLSAESESFQRSAIRDTYVIKGRIDATSLKLGRMAETLKKSRRWTFSLDLMPSCMMKDNVLDSESFSNSNSASIIPRLDSLPPELLQQIVSISESRAKSILCLICKSISTISNESLYRTVLLNSSSKVRLLAKSLNNQSSPSSSSASRSKCKDEDAAYQSDLPNLYHLLIASQDGLMSPNETITIQKEWSPSLKSIFTSDNSLTLRTVALISRPSGAALESFLSKHTGARPNNVSIYRLS